MKLGRKVYLYNNISVITSKTNCIENGQLHIHRYHILDYNYLNVWCIEIILTISVARSRLGQGNLSIITIPLEIFWGIYRIIRAQRPTHYW